MAVAGIVFAAALVLSSTGCNDDRASRHASGERLESAGQDTLPHVLSADDRDLILRARALDRANKLDSARMLYESAAEKIDIISDWLYLRAAGVTSDSSTRQKYYAKLKTDVARARRLPTEALALERTGDRAGAMFAYEAAGMRLDALRIAATPPSDSSTVAMARRALIGYLATPRTRDEERQGVVLFDNVFPQSTAAEQLVIGRAAYQAGMAARSVAAFEAAFKSGLGTSGDHFSTGLMLARLNKDAAAAAEFAKVVSPPGLAAAARYQRARALLASGNEGAARAALRGITTAFPTDTSAASALLLLSDLATDELRDGDARSTLLTIVKRFPRSRHAPTALFRAALIAYVSGSYAAAAAEWDSLSTLYPSSEDALAAAYWAGRARQQRGDTAGAHARWRAVMEKDPASYYSVLSARRLGVPTLRDSSREDRYPQFPDISEESDRAAALRDAGMDAEAKFEYDHLYSGATKSRERLVATAHALSGGDQSSRSMELGRRVVGLLGPTPQNFRLMYPVVDLDVIAASSRENGLDPALVAGLIRQESSFNPRATSPVGARGLMQLMPDVGRTLARSRGASNFDIDRLYEPDLNIRLGTAHLAGLFRGNRETVQAVAAYNAGESRVTRWLKKTGSADPEVFTERIPFLETRDYVRSVVRNRAFYKTLYDWSR